MVMALEFCASLAVHMIAANPLSHASLLPSGSKVVNALCEEALDSQKYCSGRLLVLEECGVQDLYCQMAGGGGLLSFSPPSEVGRWEMTLPVFPYGVAVLAGGLQGRKWRGTFCNL